MDTKDLLELQSRCRRDADSYRPEFDQQVRGFHALLQALKLKPSDPSQRLGELANFIANVAGCFKTECRSAGEELLSLLNQHAAVMEVELRRALVRAVAVMRSKGILQSIESIPVFFSMLQVRDKLLRKTLHQQIVADIKTINKKSRNDQVNRKLQAFMFKMIQDKDETLVKRALNVTMELFRCNAWNDSQTVNMISLACFHASPNVYMMACRFLLNSNPDDEDEDENEEDEEHNDNESDLGDEDENGKKKKRNDGYKYNPGGGKEAQMLREAYGKTQKKNARKKKRLERAITKLQKKSRVRGPDGEVKNPFDAIMLLNDPQSFAERLFSDIQNRRKNEKYEVRLMGLNLVTQLIGTHRLLVLNLYPYFQRMLQPHQRDITVLLAYLAQGVHELIPPDALHPLIRTIADHFIADRCSEEMIAAGLNAVRAICSRSPLAIENPEATPDSDELGVLLQELVSFKDHRDKGVSMAARSLMQLYREAKPSLLLKKDRGKDAHVKMMNGMADEYKFGKLMVANNEQGMEWLTKSLTGEPIVSENGDENEIGPDEEGSDDEFDDSGSEHASSGIEEEEEEEESGVEDGSEDDVDSGSDAEELENVSDESGLEDASCSDSDDDDDGEDRDKIGSLEEPAPALRQKGKSPRYIEPKILTNADFAEIKRLRAEHTVHHALTGVKHEGISRVRPEDIESYKKKRRRSLEERLESVRAGREDRDKFGSSKNRKEKKGGSTNTEKLKNKDLMMVMNKKKRRRKQLSMREKQIKKKKKSQY